MTNSQYDFGFGGNEFKGELTQSLIVSFLTLLKTTMALLLF